MGNAANSTSNFCKLHMQKYPENVPEEKWLPADSYHSSKQNKEVLVSPNGDQRIRAEPNDYKTQIKMHNKHQIYNIVRLKIQYSTHHCFGSGTIIHHSLQKSFVLTAAHNVVEGNDYDVKNVEYPEDAWMEINENTSNGYKTIKRYKCRKYAIHPKYIKFLQTENIKESATGYDIAIIEVFDPENDLKKIQPMNMRVFETKITDTMKVKVIGYPGEENLRGQLYGMKGDAEVKYVSNKIQYNKLMVYTNIDTTAGQSGCPIIKVSTDEKKEMDEKCDVSDDNIYESFGEIVGVHVIGQPKRKLNFGTMLNDEILKWIHESVYTNCVDYDKCMVSVLLITSSKETCARSLNEIYSKCVKSKIMNVMRLYYDYVEEQMVTKEDILFYIKRMFEKQQKRYLIFYCGESDEHGNWKINGDEKDNISLHDISLCAELKHNKSKLFIVTDCSNSGNWVTLKRSNNNAFKNISEIQASSKENESCNAGTFTSKYAQCCFSYIYVESNINAAGISKVVGTVSVGGLSALTIGTLYDGIVKQPFHKATKQSQPTSTVKQHQIYHLNEDSDELMQIDMFFYNSWYWMDSYTTFWAGSTVGTAGSAGFL